MSRILLVNQEAGTAKILTKLLKTEGYKVATADSSESAAAMIASEEFSLIVADVGKETDPDLAVLTASKTQAGLPAILIAERDEELLASIQAAEPFACVEKPLKVDKLLTLVQKAVDFHDTALAESTNLNLQLETLYKFESVVAESPAMKSVCDMVSRVAATDVTVAIVGEPGTGKTAIAKALHDSSRRADQPFVSLDSETAGDSIAGQLFGQGDKPGGFEKAAGGTLFVREIGRLAMPVQKQLAAAMKDRTFSRLGADAEQDVAVRFAVSSSQDLAALSAEGGLDVDLYNLIKVIMIKIPPLRQRKQDVMPTIRQVLQQQVGPGQALPSLDPEVTKILEDYDWPENVSEIKRVLKAALQNLQDGKLVKASLPAPLV